MSTTVVVAAVVIFLMVYNPEMFFGDIFVDSRNFSKDPKNTNYFQPVFTAAFLTRSRWRSASAAHYSLFVLYTRIIT